MAYRITCDNEACANEVDSGPGQPGLQPRRRVYCARCAAYLEGVEEELRQEESRLAREAAARIDALRTERMKRLVPKNQLGAAASAPPEPVLGNPPREAAAPSPWPVAVVVPE